MTLSSSPRSLSGVKQLGVFVVLVSLIAILLSTALSQAAGAATTCTRTDNADGTVTLDWDGNGDVKWAVRRGQPGANFFEAVIRDTPTYTGGNVAEDYTLRYVESGNVEVLCTEAQPPPDGVCGVELLPNGDVQITVNDNGANSWAWRRAKDGGPSSYKGEVTNFVAIDPQPAPATYAYEVVSRIGGGNTVTDQCGTITIDPVVGAQDCNATLNNDGTVTVTWIDDGANLWSVFRGVDGGNTGFVVVGENFTYTDTNPPVGQVQYDIRSVFSQDNRPKTTCGTVTITDGPGALQCSAVLNNDGTVTVSWTDDGARKWAVRRSVNGGNVGFLFLADGLSYVDANPQIGDNTYIIRSIFGDNKPDTTCGTVTIDGNPPPPALTCASVVNADGTATITWTDDGAPKWAIRRSVDGAPSTYVDLVENALTYTDAAPPAGDVVYIIRSIFGDFKPDTTCSTDGGGGDDGCTATLLGDGSVEISWADDGADKWSVFRSVNGAARTFLNLDTTVGYIDANAPAGQLVYTVRSVFANGDKPEVTCNVNV